MNLVQKLPVGLGLAFLMMMSSCSKEDAQVPQPHSANFRSDAQSREELLNVDPFIAPINGPTGFDIHPSGWERKSYPKSPYGGTGVSNLTHAYGNIHPDYVWAKPLPPIPSSPNTNSVLTFTTRASFLFQIDKRSIVQTTIKNLVVGQKYAIDYFGATTSQTSDVYGQGYARGIIATLSAPSVSKTLDLLGKQAQWVKGSLIFTAVAPETTIEFTALSEKGNYAYAHIYVDGSSIKKLL